MRPKEPRWLNWSRRLQAIAQSGLAFAADPYDVERYGQVRQIAAEIMGAKADVTVDHAVALFAEQAGYATPKVDVRGAAFRQGRILLVRERADQNRWTLPGGWADVGASPRENVAREVEEESGFVVRVIKLIAVLDRSRQDHTPFHAFHSYKLFFQCEIVGGAATANLEASEVAFFDLEEIGGLELSLSRVLPHQLVMCFEHAANPALPTVFD